jgi:hypothetical protein
MKTQTTQCLNCLNSFESPIREINRGHGKFCCRSCSNTFNNKNRWAKLNIPNVICSQCGKRFYKNPSKRLSSKSGLYFCCRICKDQAQRIGGIKEIMPPHYGTSNGKYSYRQWALKHYGEKCQTCGYDKYPEVLIVHHKDQDRSNNRINNLIVLCANCHYRLHYGKQ